MSWFRHTGDRTNFMKSLISINFLRCNKYPYWDPIALHRWPPQSHGTHRCPPMDHRWPSMGGSHWISRFLPIDGRSIAHGSEVELKWIIHQTHDKFRSNNRNIQYILAFQREQYPKSFKTFFRKHKKVRKIRINFWVMLKLEACFRS